jgi:hypothetical protein
MACQYEACYVECMVDVMGVKCDDTYLKGVGSFLLRILRGLFTLTLTMLLA